jgi:hypothetical protein
LRQSTYYLAMRCSYGRSDPLERRTEPALLMLQSPKHYNQEENRRNLLQMQAGFSVGF